MLAPLRMTDRKEWVSGRKSGVDCPSKRKQILRFAQDDNPKKSGCQSSRKWKCNDRRWLQVKVKSRGRGRPRHTGVRPTQVSVPHKPRPTQPQTHTCP